MLEAAKQKSVYDIWVTAVGEGRQHKVVNIIPLNYDHQIVSKNEGQMENDISKSRKESLYEVLLTAAADRKLKEVNLDTYNELF